MFTRLICSLEESSGEEGSDDEEPSSEEEVDEEDEESGDEEDDIIQQGTIISIDNLTTRTCKHRFWNPGSSPKIPNRTIDIVREKVKTSPSRTKTPLHLQPQTKIQIRT